MRSGSRQAGGRDPERFFRERLAAPATRMPYNAARQMILDALQRIANQSQSLSRPEAREVMAEVLAGKCTDAQIAALLIALRMKGETVEEIVGFAEAIRAAAAPLPSRGSVEIQQSLSAALAAMRWRMSPPTIH